MHTHKDLHRLKPPCLTGPIVGFLGQKRLQARAAELTGYDTEPAGQIRFAA
jgi:hypothetical protein